MDERKADTRRKIALGGLIVKAGLADEEEHGGLVFRSKPKSVS